MASIASVKNAAKISVKNKASHRAPFLLELKGVMMAEKIVCVKCGRLRPETEFFKLHGKRDDMCKDCLCQYIDNTNPETFL